eukprot:jgi/Chrzof1/2142/Cz11g03320.t1
MPSTKLFFVGLALLVAAVTARDLLDEPERRGKANDRIELYQTVNIRGSEDGKGALRFAVIGDYGRKSGLQPTYLTSQIADNGQQGLDASGYCTTKFNDQRPIYSPFGKGDKDQITVAESLEKACARKGCQFVVNVGDNFYECVSTSHSPWQSLAAYFS